MPDPVCVLGHGPDALDHLSRQHRLAGGFRGAGLPAPVMRLETAAGGGETIGAWLDALAALAESLQGAMQRDGIVRAEELDLASLTALHSAGRCCRSFPARRRGRRVLLSSPPLPSRTVKGS